MKILVVGGGGREHALVWKLAQSPNVDKLYVTSRNGGTGELAENVSISSTDTERLLSFADRKGIDLTVVGPEGSLVAGIVDLFQREGFRIFGPTKAAAEIESSKAFAKQFMASLRVPTPPFQLFKDYTKALRYLRQHGVPIVVKASGLALGKGAYPCKTLFEAETALGDIMVRHVHGDAGEEVVIEEFIDGQETSIHVFCDGQDVVLMPPIQDYKPFILNGQELNTGGMGAYTPVPWITEGQFLQIEEKIVKPTLEGLHRKEIPFVGCLYPGLMITSEGPQVLEYNARLGDPETQVLMRLLRTDLSYVLGACIDGQLPDIKVRWNSGFAVCVVLASKGYPGGYQKGIPIKGIEEAEQVPGVVIFHAGTRVDSDGELRTSGGRVLSVTAVGETLNIARDRAYEAVNQIHFDGMQYRRDIAAESPSS